MSKHLKLQGKWIPQIQRVELKLLHRTHIEYEFGGGDTFCHDSRASWAFKHGSVVLASDSNELEISYSQSYNPSEGDRDLVLNIPDSLGHGPCCDKIRVTLEEWNKIKEAVEAYNEYFKLGGRDETSED